MQRCVIFFLTCLFVSAAYILYMHSCEGSRQNHDLNESLNQMEFEHVKKYIIFTTQRSGSTWFCGVLRAQRFFDCGVPRAHLGQSGDPYDIELMIKYSLKCKDINSSRCTSISWEIYLADLQSQFEQLKRVRTENAVAIGFKLMYDAVPSHLIARFLKWLVSAKITVIHLVREAAVLNLASRIQSAGHMHTTDEAFALSQQTELVPLNMKHFRTIKSGIQRLEREHQFWVNSLQYDHGIVHYYISYEHVIGPHAKKYFRALMAFTIGDVVNSISTIDMTGVLLKLHPSSCRERLLPELYQELRSTFESQPSSKFLSACEYLDNLNT